MQQRFLITIAGLACALLLLPLSARAGLQVSVNPDPLLVGEAGQLRLVSDGDTPKVVALPQMPGLEWLGGPQVSTSVRFVNLQKSVTSSVVYLFRVNQAGAHTMPAFPVEVGRHRQMTTPITFRVEPGRAGTGEAARNPEPDEVFFLTLALGDAEAGPRRVFVGQEVVLEMRVHVLEHLYHTLSYPVIEADPISFIEDAARNPENPRFEPPRVLREIRDGQPFRVVVLRCRVLPLAAGTLKGQVTVTAQLQMRERRRTRPTNDPFAAFDDAFFDDFFATRQAITRQVTAPLPAIPVEPLPAPPPELGPFLGLTGDWQMELNLVPGAVPLGEPASLTLDISGHGGLAALSPPPLALSGFRVFDPEVKRVQRGDSSQATVTWVLVPLAADAELPELRFCTFDPGAAAYRGARFQPRLQVQPVPAGRTGVSVVVDAATGRPGTAAAGRQPHAAHDILYIKTTPGPALLRPLWQNRFWLPLGLVLGGPLLYAATSIAAARRERLRGSLAYRRRLAALRERRQLLRELPRVAGSEHAALIRERLVPCVAALCDLPPGTTAEALAAHVAARNPELAQALRSAAQDGFRPGSNADTPAGDLPPRLVARALRRFSLLLPLLLLPLAGAGTPETPDTLAAATEAYDAGRVEEAAQRYAALAAPGRESPHLLYNQANCAFRLGRLGEALALYERAWRLAPRDSDVLENLNFVRARLGLPRVGGLDSPKALLVRARDSLRPDEWLCVAAAALCAGATAGAWRRWRRQAPGPAFAATLGVVLVALLAIVSQLQTTYARDRQGIVLRDDITPRRLPAADAERADLPLREGEPVRITEQRPEWLRVRSGDAEAWVPRRALGVVW